MTGELDMEKIINKQIELETLEIAVEALESKIRWAENEIIDFENNYREEDEKSPYQVKRYERNKLVIEKCNELIEKLENMI